MPGGVESEGKCSTKDLCQAAVREQAGSRRNIARATQKPTAFVPAKDFP